MTKKYTPNMGEINMVLKRVERFLRDLDNGLRDDLAYVDSALAEIEDFDQDQRAPRDGGTPERTNAG